MGMILCEEMFYRLCGVIRYDDASGYYPRNESRIREREQIQNRVCVSTVINQWGERERDRERKR